MAEMDWNPDLYLREIQTAIPRFDDFQDAVAEATLGTEAHAVLELGVGTGETARRVRALHPDASWTAIDASEAMLGRAREALLDADLLVGRLEDRLPAGPFDLVVSALAVHHLDAHGKRDLFRRVADSLRPAGTFVLGDVVVPDVPKMPRSRSTGSSTCPIALPTNSSGCARRGSTPRSCGAIATSRCCGAPCANAGPCSPPCRTTWRRASSADRR